MRRIDHLNQKIDKKLLAKLDQQQIDELNDMKVEEAKVGETLADHFSNAGWMNDWMDARRDAQRRNRRS